MGCGDVPSICLRGVAPRGSALECARTEEKPDREAPLPLEPGVPRSPALERARTEEKPDREASLRRERVRTGEGPYREAQLPAALNTGLSSPAWRARAHSALGCGDVRGAHLGGVAPGRSTLALAEELSAALNAGLRSPARRARAHSALGCGGVLGAHLRGVALGRSTLECARAEETPDKQAPLPRECVRTEEAPARETQLTAAVSAGLGSPSRRPMDMRPSRRCVVWEGGGAPLRTDGARFEVRFAAELSVGHR